MEGVDTIAVFDFDGTVTTGDSLFDFVAWGYPRRRLFTDLVMTLPLLVLRAFYLVGNDRHKMALFARRFAGMPAADFEALAHRYSHKRLPLLVRTEALERLKQHQEQGHHVVIVTASPVNWIGPWAESQGIEDVVGNTAEARDGVITGRLSGQNCYGDEKVNRLLALVPDLSAYTLIAYGDSRGDRELLAAADKPFYRSFS